MGLGTTLLTSFLLLRSVHQVLGGDVAVIMGGYSDPAHSTAPYSKTEFFTQRQDSCVYSNITTLFDYNWGQSNSLTLTGVYVENQGIFACPGDCVHLNSSRLPGSAWVELPCRASTGQPVDCDRTDGMAVWQNDRGFIHFSKEANIHNHNTLVYTVADDLMDIRPDIYMNSKNSHHYQ